MPAGQVTLFSKNKDDLRINDLVGATVKIALLTSAYTPNIDSSTGHALFADVSANEIAAGNGYAAGGGTPGGNAATAITNGFKFNTADMVFTAAGGSIPAWRYAVLYVSGALWGQTNPLLGYFLGDNTPADIPATTGTGALTLAGAKTNFRAFSAVCANSDVVPYSIVHQTAAEWETGLGTWGTGGTLTRTTVLDSSNAGAAVNFSAGTKDVFITALASALPEEEAGLWFHTKAAGQRILIDGSAMSVLQADFTGQNATGNQPFFPTGQDAFTLEAGTTYLLEGHISTLRAAGATSHTTGVNFGGTATFTMARYSCDCRYGARSATTPVRPYTAEYKGTTPSTNQIVQLAATTVNSKVFNFDGIVVVNAAGTIIPQFQYSAVPGGAPVVERGSYFRFTPIGNASVTNIGAWA